MSSRVSRRRDTQLRTSIDRLQASFSRRQTKEYIYQQAIAELCNLSSSTFGFALAPVNVVNLHGRAPQEEGKTPAVELLSGYGLTDVGLVLVDGVTEGDAANDSKAWLESLLAFKDPVILSSDDIHNGSVFKSSAPKHWPRINSMMVLPIYDCTELLSILVLCNPRNDTYDLSFHQRIRPLLVTLLSMLHLLIRKSADGGATPHLAIERDLWQDAYFTLEASSPQAMVVLDQQLKIMRINPSAQRLFKKSVESLVGKSVSCLIPERYPNEHLSDNFTESNLNKTLSFSLPIGTCEGYPHWVKLNVVPVRTMEYFQQRTVLLINALESDAGQQVGEVDQSFRALADASPVGILQTDTQWRCTYVNQSWLDQCDLTRAEVQELRWTSSFHPNEAEKILRQLYEVAETEQVFEGACLLEARNGKQHWAKLYAQPMFDKRGLLSGFVMTLFDNTYYHTSLKLRQMMEEDGLTKLSNRKLFLSRLEHALSRAKRKGGLALLAIDLDGFKNVNDSLGHDAGDELLIEVSRRLAHTVRETDTVARFGGDEFMVLLEDIETPQVGAQVAEKILQQLSAPFTLQQQQIFISASIGIRCSFLSDDQTSSVLLKQADIALYRAKAEGRNNYQFYSLEMELASRQRLEMGNSLHRGLQNQEFLVFYQLQADVNTQQFVGLEALLRWQHPKHGVISPDQFLPLMEDVGLVLQVSVWQWRQAFAQMQQWLRVSWLPADATISVNFSARLFRDAHLVQLFRDALQESGLSPHNVVVEITESTIMRDDDETLAMLAELKSMGVGIAIDDFGTGYSSLSYLKKFPIDTIKIDKSFVRDLLVDKEDAAIVQAVIALAKSLQLAVVAEGVETKEVLAQLKAWGCDFYQGYLLNQPMSCHHIQGHIALAGRGASLPNSPTE